MMRKTVGLVAMLVALVWVLATAMPVEARRYSRHHGHKHYGYRSSVVTTLHVPYYAPYFGSYYYSPYYYRPYPYGYPYYGAPVAYGWPFFWPGVSFYFRF